MVTNLAALRIAEGKIINIALFVLLLKALFPKVFMNEWDLAVRSTILQEMKTGFLPSVKKINDKNK